MEDRLLSRVLDAHGGLARWSDVDRISARLTLGGPFWAAKGQPHTVGRKTLEADTRQERIALTPFAAADWDLEFLVDPERVVVTDAAEGVVDERTDPRASFSGYDPQASWDTLQTGYFIGYALWNYLTEPFLFTFPGVEAREVDPWQEGGETWHRLHVVFPGEIATHDREQTFYFDDSAMLRRMDYAPEVDGGALFAQYTYEPKSFDGIVAPTRHRMHKRRPDGTADLGVDLITIDISHLEYHRS